MRERWSPEELVRTTESIHLSVRERYRNRYDGATEHGAGPFSIVVPGHSAAYIEDYWSEMDPLPWADEHPVDHEDVYLDDPIELDRLFQKIDAYTDGAVLIEGDGRIFPYTVELTPDVALEESYGEGWGTKNRTALNISGVDVTGEQDHDRSCLERYFPAVKYRFLDPDGEWRRMFPGRRYGDIVSITTGSTTGATKVFDRGQLLREHDGVVEPRNMKSLWERVLEESR